MRNTSHPVPPRAIAEPWEQGVAFASQVAGIVEELATAMAMLPDVGGREPAFSFRPRFDAAKPECGR